MMYRHLLTGGAKWLLAGAMLVGSATSAKAVILDGNGSPTPEDPNLKAWFRADFGVSTDANGVTLWDDFSDLATGTARDLVPSILDAAHQPTYIPSDPIFNGQPSVSFDGVQDVLNRVAGNSPVSGNSDRTVIAVVSTQQRPATNGIAHVLHFGNSSVDQSYGIMYMQGYLPTYGNHYWGGFDPGNAATGYSSHVVTYTYDNDFYAGEGRAGADRFWVNGLNGGTIDLQATNTAATAPAHQLKTGTGQFVVGSRIALSGGNPVEHLKGNIAEIIVYDTALSDVERSAVESYLGGRYGIGIGPQTAVPGPFSINAGNFDTAVKSLTFNGNTARPTTDPVDAAPVARLTDATNSQSGTVWLNRPVAFANDMSFSTQFEFRASAGYGVDCCGDAPGADGLTFIIHQDPRGDRAIGAGGGTMGYVGGTVGGQNPLMVQRSLVIELDTWHTGSFDLPSNNGTNGNHVGLNVSTARYTLEQSAAGAIPQITSGDPRNVWVDYDGKTRTMDVYVSDTNVKPGAPTFTQKIDLSQVFSSNELYVGFAGATGGAGANYDIRSWDFDSQESASAPAAVAPTEFDFPSFGGFDPFFTFNGTGSAGVVGDRLRLTDNSASQAGSAIFSEAVTLAPNFRFHTKFSVELTLPGGGGPAGPGVNGPGADGMTFVLATGPNGPNIVGGGGGALGLDGISANFVAVELDTWGGGAFDGGIVAGQQHVGVDASNTTLIGPASYGTANLPRFNDGGEHFVWIDYFGETEEMKVYVSDVDAKPAMPTLTVSIDVAGILGYLNEDVYMGFTAGTGGAVNVHEVLSWSLAAVPEPSTYVLLSMGVAGLFFARRRRK